MKESDTGLFNKEKCAKRFAVGDQTRSHNGFPLPYMKTYFDSRTSPSTFSERCRLGRSPGNSGQRILEHSL